jgi:hypothetical protein
MKGLELCERFYHEVVRPILDVRFPQVIHSAGRLDSGSDVLGFDTPQSRDHGWGPKVMLFVSESDDRQYREEILQGMAEELPYEIHGYSTNFAREGGDEWLQPIIEGAVDHGITVTTVSRFFRIYTGLDMTQPIGELNWLAVPPQRLRTIVSGRVFHDGLEQLETIRQTLCRYPRDVWLYLMANQWRKIDQEEPFMARCGDVGDELGSRIVAARLIYELMRLCFLMEQEYIPYSKWFGTAFARLQCAETLTPIFHQVFGSTHWKEREQSLSQAYLFTAQMHNELGVTPLIEPEVSPFYNRPYQVPHSRRFVDALHKAIKSETIKALPPHVGAVWQFTDSTDILEHIERCQAFKGIAW